MPTNADFYGSIKEILGPRCFFEVIQSDAGADVTLMV